MNAQFTDSLPDWLNITRQTICQAKNACSNSGFSPSVFELAFPLPESVCLLYVSHLINVVYKLHVLQ